MEELVDYVSIYDLIHEHNKIFVEDEIQEIIQKVVSALCLLHEKGITHGHLTLKNIFVNEDKQIKITDFAN